MKEMRERIAFLQNNLNRALSKEGIADCRATKIYLLSVRLDQEIAKYYESLKRTTC